MTNPYSHLLSPFKIGNVTLKNRMMGSKCALQSFTLEQAREFYADMARNGATTGYRCHGRSSGAQSESPGSKWQDAPYGRHR